MTKLKNYKLKYQLAILLSISISIMILVQALYYLKFNYVTINKATMYTQNIINQVNNKMNIIAEGIQKTSYAIGYNKLVQNYIMSEDENIELQASNNANVEEYLLSIIELDPYVSGVILLGKDKKMLLSSDYAQFGSDKYAKLLKEFKISSYQNSFFTPVINFEQGKTTKYYYCYISPIYNIGRDSNIKTRIGWSIVFCGPHLLEDNVKSTSISEASLFCVVDSNNNVVVSNRGDLLYTVFEPDTYINNINRKSFNNLSSKRSISIVNSIKLMDWITIGIIPIYELTSELRQIKNTGVFISFIATIVLLSIGWIFIRSINNPIAEIVKMLRKIGEMNIKQRLQVKVSNEMGVIAESINKMLDKLENMASNIFEMQARLYESEIRKKEADLLALQSQINPHFLYNTLECIRSIAINSNITEITDITTAMARIFRYSIKGDYFVEVGEEIKCLEDYLKIISIRFLGKINYSINVDNEIINKKILKMILEPIVENAIRHGLENKYGNGRVNIKGCLYNKILRFEICDDGVGMTSEDLEVLTRLINNNSEIVKDKLNNNRSIGLVNINNRIKLYYGKQYGISIFSTKDEGTTVILDLPVQEDNENIIAKEEGTNEG